MDIVCGTQCTVTVQLEPAPMTEERMQDMLQLFGLFIIPIILVWGGRLLYDFFNRGPNDGS